MQIEVESGRGVVDGKENVLIILKKNDKEGALIFTREEAEELRYKLNKELYDTRGQRSAT